MTRAEMCENIGLQSDKDEANVYFIVGLFPTLDAPT